MSFRLWIAVVQAYPILVLPSKGKIGQQYHTKKRKKKRGSGETRTSTHKSLNFHKEISCYILQCFLGNHYSVKGTLCLLLFVKLFEPPHLCKRLLHRQFMQHLIKAQSAVCCTITSNISISSLNILDCIC